MNNTLDTSTGRRKFKKQHGNSYGVTMRIGWNSMTLELSQIIQASTRIMDNQEIKHTDKTGNAAWTLMCHGIKGPQRNKKNMHNLPMTKNNGHNSVRQTSVKLVERALQMSTEEEIFRKNDRCPQCHESKEQQHQKNIITNEKYYTRIQ
uniref:Uncharacterized protein n=1 Tax=Cacopsylla melanoneura TaxID=428564 RepID=A0A8D8PQY2_9HEMI